MLLYAENKGGELVQKTSQSALTLALSFALKLQKRWKLWKNHNCALDNLGILQSFQNIIQDLSNSF